MRRAAANLGSAVAKLEARRLFDQRAVADIVRLASEQEEVR